jgi:twitching motility protein PilT
VARIDPYIETLFTLDGQELIFETGAGAYVRTKSGPRPVIRQTLTAQQIVGAFAEIVPPESAQTYPAEGATNFAYGSPAGAVLIRMEKRGGMVRVLVLKNEEAAAAVPAMSPSPEAAGTETTLAPVSVAIDTQEKTELRRSWAWGPTKVNVPAPAARPIVEQSVFPRSGEAREHMDALLAFMLQQRASDLHLSTGSPPILRIDGQMKAFNDKGVFEPDRLQELLFSIAPERNQEEWKRRKDTDFAHETESARFRVNLFADRKGIGAVLRQIPNRIITAEEMGLSPAVLELCNLTKGLVVVTGPTGSGKSTTLAAMIDYINRNREDHIITIEDPIEFVHPNKKCLLNQREVGVNTDGFKTALRAALREDPDIVLVGEMRDLETVAIAIETAETGHLVFGTLHTNTAASTVDRIIDQFPPDRQQQVRLMLSESLKGVIAQTLCRKIGGGRVAALEILICTPAVSNLIREGKTFQIPSVMQTGRNLGMQTLNDALLDLVKRRVIDPDEAYKRAVAKAELKVAIERAGFKAPG